MNVIAKDGQGIGARILRKEDDRHMRGRGRFIADMKMAGLQEVAFVRSPLAHAMIRAVTKPSDAAGKVFLRADLASVKPIRSVMRMPGFNPSEQHPLAHEKVRFVGEPIAMCVGETRARAEDMAETVDVALEELPAVVDALGARNSKTGPFVHDGWGSHLFLETSLDTGISEAAKAAAVTVKREYFLSRQVMNPMEGKAVLAYWDDPKGQLVVYSSNSSAAHDPHGNRGASRN